jgi:hypothetical protein
MARLLIEFETEHYVVCRVQKKTGICCAAGKALRVVNSSILFRTLAVEKIPQRS